MITIPALISPAYCQSHPDWIFIGGWNKKKQQPKNSGHSMLYHACPNVMYISTKIGPCHKAEDFWSDLHIREFESTIGEELRTIYSITPERPFMVTLPGLGKWDDESQLEVMAPGCFGLLTALLMAVRSDYMVDYKGVS